MANLSLNLIFVRWRKIDIKVLDVNFQQTKSFINHSLSQSFSFAIFPLVNKNPTSRHCVVSYYLDPHVGTELLHRQDNIVYTISNTNKTE
jgi:hypothetical protein